MALTLSLLAAAAVAASEPPVHGADPFPSASPAPLATRPVAAPSVSLLIDQDSVLPWLGPWGGDQNYTMGLAFQVTGDWVKRSWLSRPLGWVDRFTGLARLHRNTTLGIDAKDSAEVYGLNLANGAFTPRRIESKDLIFDDRPYASLLAVTLSHVTVNGRRREALKTELTIGVLGLRLSEWVQTKIHTARRKRKQQRDPSDPTPYDPLGWPNQVSDGGEPTAKYTVTFTKELGGGRAHDFGVQTEASLGYYTNVAAGPILRLGKRRSGIWGVANNPLSSVNQALYEVQSAEPTRVPAWEAYLFAAGRARLVAYNALMQGALRHSAVSYDQTQIEPLVRELEVGAALGWRGSQLTVTLAHRSPEFDAGIPRSHTWGGIYFTQRFRGEQLKP